MSERLLMGVLMSGFGALLVTATAMQWRWLVEGRKYRRLADAFGPKVPAILYVVVGLILVGMGIANLAGAWPGRP